MPKDPIALPRHRRRRNGRATRPRTNAADTPEQEQRFGGWQARRGSATPLGPTSRLRCRRLPRAQTMGNWAAA
eukprot:6294623-Lingulodinium_polyedra.AAC.1